MRMYQPPHPGKVLKEYLGGISVSEAARKLVIGRTTLSRILHGTSGISVGMALRLGIALGTSPDLWAGLQRKFDLSQTRKRARPEISR